MHRRQHLALGVFDVDPVVKADPFVLDESLAHQVVGGADRVCPRGLEVGKLSALIIGSIETVANMKEEPRHQGASA